MTHSWQGFPHGNGPHVLARFIKKNKKTKKKKTRWQCVPALRDSWSLWYDGQWAVWTKDTAVNSLHSFQIPPLLVTRTVQPTESVAVSV